LANTRRDTTDLDRLIGARIRMLRKLLRMSQTTLGDRIGVSFQQIQKYELGRNRIGAGRLQLVAEVLDVPVEYFFADAPSHAETVIPGALDLLRAYGAIKDPAARKAVLSCAQILATIRDRAS